MRRRRGELTEEDRAVWAAYAQRVRVLPGRAVPPLPSAPTVTITPPPRPAAPPPPKPRLPPPEVAVGAPPPGLDARRWRDLRRGKLRPERKLDLHGMTAAAAHGAVSSFLHSALADGVRCVCIVTGKGSSAEGGVLRRELPHWLNAPGLRGLVLGAAHPHRANAGAVHLLLRRPRA
ncbi:Smr/MutS family protein [Sabulicella glaciei]|uniref:Smr/MutS family protein n=1 Tax=Sabulicella glaciei TaxID=2984948 RepID=A0ABT3NV11_9PROT|nr:Smr/MutS family protein [Roseococcus sp. MDT2-1-1]MCW8086007.1 Smr/MutS family protein [Roseococcus sp. MDT2-1-1]